MIKRKADTDYSETAKIVYTLLSQKFRYSARVSYIWELLLYAFNLEEYSNMNYKEVINGSFESYLIEKIDDFKGDKGADFTEVKESVFKSGDLSNDELITFERGEIEHALWAIFILLTSGPDLDLNNIN